MAPLSGADYGLLGVLACHGHFAHALARRQWHPAAKIK